MIKIKSKLFIPFPPSRGAVILSVLSIIVFVGMLILGLLGMIIDGFSLSVILEIIVAGILVLIFYPDKSKGEYINADADLMIDMKGALDILYKGITVSKGNVKDVWFIVDPAQLATMEYNARLSAIRFTGKILKLVGEKERMFIPEYILNIEEGNIDEIKTLIETNTPMRLEFVDIIEN